MTSLENENPYKASNIEEPAPNDAAETEFQLTGLEWGVLGVLALVVAIPTFFTTCIGGGFALLAVVGIHGEVSGLAVFVLWGASILIAVWAGFVVARKSYRKKRRRASLGDHE